MKFKKIYLEITNICNLNCSFCPGNSRVKKFMEINDFKFIINRLKGYTNYLYFHLMGEPLMHPEINKFIDLASDNFKVNITTNGYLIDRIGNNKNIRQVNISLHSFNPKYGISLNEYLNNIFATVDNLLVNDTIVNYRIWVSSIYMSLIIKIVEARYQIKINGNTKIKNNLFVNFDTEFIWPDINNDYCNMNGTCQGLRTHVGILVDGSVVPCCLDYNGNLKLGNIFNNELNEILVTERAQEMLNGFINNNKIEKMCQHCNFYDRINSTKRSDKNDK